MRITKKYLISFIFLTFSFAPVFLLPSLTSTAQADDTLIAQQEGLSEVRGIFGGFRAEKDIRLTAMNFVLLALSFLGVIFLALTIYAGFIYMTSGGNQEKTGQAIKLLRNAIIGVAIILAAWIITRFVIVMLNRSTLGIDVSTYPKY